ncbi:MAG: HTH domain-containing protein [Bacilli bacterium]|uniref:BglG family transcription antiterminator n=1 Tax=Anaerorhabdus sp. TaxID=1872524 RepID=UPI002FC85242
MISSNNRVLLIYHTLANSNKVLVCKELANIAKVSERTVKNDLVYLKELAKKSGCVLHSKKGEGYWIEVIDQNIFDTVNEELNIRFSNLADNRSTVLERSNHLARIVIIQEDYIKLDDLADLLFLSKSSIKAELKELRSLFKAFNLELETKSGHGIRVEGKEISKRLCMLELYEVHYRKTISFLGNTEYTRYFDVSEKEGREIRDIFLNTLRYSEYSILDSFGNRIINYFKLMRKRIEKGYKMVIGKEYVETLKKLSEYSLAKKIIHNLQVLPNFDVDDDEIIAIELLLLVWMDLCPNDNLEKRYGEFYHQSVSLANKIFSEIEKKWNINLNINEKNSKDFCTCLLPILFQIHFKCSQYLVIGTLVDNCTIKASPISMVLAKTAAEVIEREYSCKITAHDINMIAVSIYSVIDEITYDYTPRNIIICSRTGKKGAYVIKNKILKRYNEKWFNKLDVFEFYEVRKYENEGYDNVICNFDKYAYNYKIPYLKVEQIPTCDQMNRIFNDIILEGYHISSVRNKCNLENCNFYTEFNYETKLSFINLLSYKHGINQNSINVIQKELDSFSDIFIRNDTIILTVNSKYTRGNCLEIYKLNKLSLWENRTIGYIVFLSIEYQNDLQVFRFIEHATSVLFSSVETLEEIIANQSVEYLVKKITQNMRAG